MRKTFGNLEKLRDYYVEKTKAVIFKEQALRVSIAKWEALVHFVKNRRLKRIYKLDTFASSYGTGDTDVADCIGVRTCGLCKFYLDHCRMCFLDCCEEYSLYSKIVRAKTKVSFLKHSQKLIVRMKKEVK